MHKFSRIKKLVIKKGGTKTCLCRVYVRARGQFAERRINFVCAPQQCCFLPSGDWLALACEIDLGGFASSSRWISSLNLMFWNSRIHIHWWMSRSHILRQLLYVQSLLTNQLLSCVSRLNCSSHRYYLLGFEERRMWKIEGRTKMDWSYIYEMKHVLISCRQV